MRSINLEMKGSIGYDEAEKAAREAASDSGGRLSLTAWFDKARDMGAPQEACALENWKCVRDYAEHHNADIRVSINNDAYEFFFSKSPADAEELDREGVEEVHKGIAVDRDENVQGG